MVAPAMRVEGLGREEPVNGDLAAGDSRLGKWPGMVTPAMRVKAIRQILKVCSDAVGALVLAVRPGRKLMVDICWIAIDKLTPNGRNVRTHSRKQIHQIADSITAFGFVVPLLIDDDGVIIAGHGRYAAAKL